MLLCLPLQLGLEACTPHPALGPFNDQVRPLNIVTQVTKALPSSPNLFLLYLFIYLLRCWGLNPGFCAAWQALYLALHSTPSPTVYTLSTAMASSFLIVLHCLSTVDLIQFSCHALYFSALRWAFNSFICLQFHLRCVVFT
jgi:hypothetical protein